MSIEQITVETTVAAPVARVWSAYTTPEGITRWNFANDDWCCPWAEVDLRPGGTHKARMEAKDGSIGFDFEGIYEDVEPEKSVTLVLADGRTSRTTFEDKGDRTRVTTTFDAETQNPIDMQRDGWQAILNSFKTFVEGGQARTG